MKEEDLIRKRCGSEEHFRIPDGYFENFTAELMSKLPEKTACAPVSRAHRMPRMIWYAVAAVCCGFVFSGILHFSQKIAPDETSATYTADTAPYENTDHYMEDYLDYAMVSNQEIASYLTEAY